MNQNKEVLSDLEFALLADAQVLPRKHRVQAKLENVLLQTGQQLVAKSLPLAWPSKAPKLSRGENYQQQAYRVMDFPRIQEGDAFLFYRTLILWGHPIGMHLIVSGHFMERLSPIFMRQYQNLSEPWRYAAHDNPWIWEAEEQALYPCQQMEFEEMQHEISKRKFLKLSRFIDLAEYATLPELSVACFAELHHLFLQPLLSQKD